MYTIIASVAKIQVSQCRSVCPDPEATRLAVVFLQLTCSALIALRKIVLMTLGMSIAVRETVLLTPGMSIAVREIVSMTPGMSDQCPQNCCQSLSLVVTAGRTCRLTPSCSAACVKVAACD